MKTKTIDEEKKNAVADVDFLMVNGCRKLNFLN